MVEQGTAPAAEPTPKPEGGAPAAAAPEVRPEFLDARFKTVEDQAKAYREAEKMAQHKSQQAAELERQNRELLSRQQQPAPQAPPQENYDELFWQKPSEVINRLIERQLQTGIQPFIEDRYTMQKQAYVADPEFSKYEAQIDQMVQMQPALKKEPNVVGRLYNAVRAMNFDVETERKRIREEEVAKLQGKALGQIEGAGAPGGPTPKPKMELSEDERSAALKLYDQIPPQEAYKKYSEAKSRMHGGA